MTFVRILILLLCIFKTSTAVAEISVRSGAHAGFSRLVFYVPRGTEWTFEALEQKSVVTLNNYSDGFDLSRVFDRIDRRHIGNVTAGTASVEIDYSCDCRAEATLVGDTMIVVDVSFAPATDEVATTTLSFGLNPILGEAPLQFSVPASSETTLEVDVVSTAQLPERPAVFAEQVAMPQASERTDVQRLNQAQEKLAEHIGMAATRGVLQPSGRRIDLSSSNRQPQINVEVFDSSELNPDAEDSVEPVGGNLRISASTDVPGAFEQALQESTNLGVQCISPTEVAIHEWADADAFGSVIANHRARLFSERDLLDRDAAIALARAYLYFGFGPEAKKVLELDPALMSEARVLADMADIMEFGELAQGRYLHHFVDCDSNVALWAQLASTSLSSSQSINSKAALRTLSAMPWHLRRFLAPVLSQKLLAYGDKDAAAAALRGLERTSNAPSAHAELARASIELASGETETAQRRLEGIVSSNAQQSAQALIKYVDTQFDADVEIEDDIATLVEAYAVEMRDDPLGDALRRAHVLALAKSDQFADAFEELDRLSFSIDARTSDDLRSSVLSLLAQNATDLSFLELAFANTAVDRQGVAPEARFKIAERLASLGFFSEAEGLLPATKGGPVTTRQRLLRAEIALGLSRPNEALAVLERESGQEADRLRALARRANGEYMEAVELYDRLGDVNNQRQSAWLSENWSDLLAESGTVLAEAAIVAQTPLDTPASLDGMLARSEAALTESARARDVLQRLLNTGDLRNEDQNSQIAEPQLRNVNP